MPCAASEAILIFSATSEIPSANIFLNRFRKKHWERMLMYRVHYDDSNGFAHSFEEICTLFTTTVGQHTCFIEPWYALHFFRAGELAKLRAVMRSLPKFREAPPSATRLSHAVLVCAHAQPCTLWPDQKHTFFVRCVRHSLCFFLFECKLSGWACHTQRERNHARCKLISAILQRE